MRHEIIEISERIKKRREAINLSGEKRKGISQQYVSDELGFSDRNKFARWENGAKIPISHLSKVCTLLECDVTHLLGEHETPYKDVAEVSSTIGLSEFSVEKLKKMNKNNKITWLVTMLDKLIISKHFLAFISAFRDGIMGLAEGSKGVMHDISISQGGIDVVAGLQDEDRSISSKDICFFLAQNAVKDIVDDLRIELGNNPKTQMSYYFKYCYDVADLELQRGNISERVYLKIIEALNNEDYKSARALLKKEVANNGKSEKT